MFFNPISAIRAEPDSILDMFQEVSQIQLNDLQLAIAKKSIAELPADQEITVLDLFSYGKVAQPCQGLREV